MLHPFRLTSENLAEIVALLTLSKLGIVYISTKKQRGTLLLLTANLQLLSAQRKNAKVPKELF